jgi:VanZ family protein
MLHTLIEKKYYKVLFYITVIAVFALAILPNGNDSIHINDKILHATAFFVLSLELNRASSTVKHRLRNIIALLIFGIFIEFAQSLTPAREASFYDVVADLVGILIFQILYFTLKFYHQQHIKSH